MRTGGEVMSEASVPAVPLETPEQPAMLPKPISMGGVGTAAGVAALADFLLYDHALGIGLVVFLAAVAASALVTNSVRATTRAAICAGGILVAGLLPFAVNPSVLSLGLAVAGVLLFSTLLFAGPGPLLSDVLAAARSMVLSCVHRAPTDLCNSLAGAASKRPKSIGAALVVWFMPLTLGAVFAALFVGANPLLESWVKAIDLPTLLGRIAEHLSGWRIGFWLAVIMLVWPVLFVHAYRRRAARARKATGPTVEGVDVAQARVVGDAAILRSLIVFNVLFAVQTSLDALYLWGGVALPEGMTHAEYAHRGAYLLIATALLSAAFVILALRPGSEAERSPLIRGLVYLWIAQNVWLVISSILRLDLYVAAYSLTYWRVAAFVWMVLVAIGLVLILARIALGRSNDWLVGANLVSLVVVLYACAFPNFARVIADFNVAHSAEMGGGGPALDRAYLYSLGTDAIPAVDVLAGRNSLAPHGWRETQSTVLVERMKDWRGWNFWDWRLVRYLAEAPIPASAAPVQGASIPPPAVPIPAEATRWFKARDVDRYGGSTPGRP
jgi:hypothetical protein